MKELYTISPYIGADPEFFLTSKDGKIIESNKIIPKTGFEIVSNSSFSGKCTQDGVQAEINPEPSSCRQAAGNVYKKIFKSLATRFNKKEIDLCSKSMVYLTPKELDELSDDSKKFGCKPSINNYTGKESVIKTNPAIYGYRSAGGHIHLGHGGGSTSKLYLCFKKKPKLIVRLLDLVLGNTCVMLDRDPNQVERRKVYGRAGEYRLPKHGIEYRTLSNFWLRNYQLMSMVYGFARLSLCIAYNIYCDEELSETKSSFRDILKASKKKDIQEAINKNDFDLAKKNWDEIKHILVSMIPNTHLNYFPINSKYLIVFEHFIKKGLDYWFKDDLLTHWTKNLKSVSSVGWENFLRRVVTSDFKNNGKIMWSLASNSGFSISRINKDGSEEVIRTVERIETPEVVAIEDNG